MTTLKPPDGDRRILKLPAPCSAGMVGARLDLAKGSMDFHLKCLQNLQQAMQITRKLCCVLVDTQGRKIMIRPKV